MSYIQNGCIFQWTIENFQFFPEGINQVLRSPLFLLTTSSNRQYYVELEKNVNLFRCKLKRNSEIIELVKLQCSLTVQTNILTEYIYKRIIKFRSNEDSVLLEDIITDIQNGIFRNRNLIITIHFESDILEFEKRMLFYHALSHVNVCKVYSECSIFLNTYQRVYNFSTLYFDVKVLIYTTESPFTLKDVKLNVMSKALHPNNALRYVTLVKLNLQDIWGKILGYGQSLLPYSTTTIVTPIHLEGDEEKQFNHQTLKLCNEFEVGMSVFTSMEKIKSLNQTEISGCQASELSLYAPLRQGTENYKICVGDKSFSVNKDFLRVVSPIFKDLVEQNGNECEIIGLSSTDDQVRFEKLLNIICCKEKLGNCEFSNIRPLYELSQMFQIVPLIKILSRAIVPTFSVSNLKDAFLLADTYKDDELREAAQSYFLFHSKNILEQQSWTDFSEQNPKLACEIILNAIQST